MQEAWCVWIWQIFLKKSDEVCPEAVDDEEGVDSDEARPEYH